MKTLAVVNQKGGCGKTTIAVNVAACIAGSGEPVLLIDMDPQGHASIALGINGDQCEPTTYNALTDDEEGVRPLSDTIIEVGDNLWLTPSNILLSAIEQQLSGKKGREDRLRECLVEVLGQYNYCVIDCPPSVGILTMNALRAAQLALIPIDMSRFSLHGIQKLMETTSVLCSQTSHIIRSRVVANMFDSRTNFSKQMLALLKHDFGDSLCKTVIHRCVKVAEAVMQGQPIRKFAPYSSAHEDFVDLAVEIAMDPALFESPAPFPARVLFSYFAPEAQEIKVAGDFNNWFPSCRHKLRKEQDGKWSLFLPLKQGKYRYKFIVDGQWREDPSNPHQEFGSFGEKNSVLEI
ncbi:MAG: AAA family ATPase [Candidatus Lindowbacteria bacterium]|nr:AAA family ATPase [Candidatus Lindowbacteria bacterium]